MQQSLSDLSAQRHITTPLPPPLHTWINQTSVYPYLWQAVFQLQTHVSVTFVKIAQGTSNKYNNNKDVTTTYMYIAAHQPQPREIK